MVNVQLLWQKITELTLRACKFAAYQTKITIAKQVFILNA
jgi:hypothetical protein